MVLMIQPVGGRQKFGVLTFGMCLQSVFGYPDDEARRGEKRLDTSGCGIYELEGSPWLDQLRTFNRNAFPDATWWPRGTYRHFIVACPENRGEFLAEDLQIDLFDDFRTAVKTAASRGL